MDRKRKIVEDEDSEIEKSPSKRRKSYSVDMKLKIVSEVVKIFALIVNVVMVCSNSQETMLFLHYNKLEGKKLFKCKTGDNFGHCHRLFET